MHFQRTAPRALAAAAFGLALANIVHLCALLLEEVPQGGHALTPARLAARLVLFSLGPALFGLALRLAGRASYSVERDRLTVWSGRARVEIPLASISEVRWSRLPFPAPALVLRLHSGRVLGDRIELEDPSPLLRALAPRVGSAGALLEHWWGAFARARAPFGRRRVKRIVVKYVLFPLLPALVTFRAHQYIAFDGPLGEYYFYGAAAYARTFAVYLTTSIALLILYGTAWRVVAEAFAVLVTAASPHRASTFRRAAEAVCAITFYLGVPALLALRFLA